MVTKLAEKYGKTPAQIVLRWGEVFERNRATFAARVRPIYERLCAEKGIVPERSFLSQRPRPEEERT